MIDMGNKKSTNRADQPGPESPRILDLFCPICFTKECLHVLGCGHFFCISCLKVIYQRHCGITCPFDRKKDYQHPLDLPLISEVPFKDLDLILFNELLQFPHFRRSQPNFKTNLSSSLACRWTTIETLRDIATLVDSIELRGSKVQVGSLSACVVGGVAVTLGLGATLTGVGAGLGIPLIVSGTAVGGSGALGSLTTNVVELLSRKRNLKRVNIRLQLDNFLSEQLITMANRAKVEHSIAETWDFSFLNALGFACVVPNVAKIGVTSVAGARTFAVVGSGVAKASLAGVGIVFAAAMIPVDIIQLVQNSLKIHSQAPSKIVQEIRNLADTLEVQLKMFYMQLGLFQLIHCYKKRKSMSDYSCEREPLDGPAIEWGVLSDESSENGSGDNLLSQNLARVKLMKSKEKETQDPKSNPVQASEMYDSSPTSESDDSFLFIGDEFEGNEGADPGNQGDVFSKHVAELESIWMYSCIDPVHSDEFQLMRDLGSIEDEVLPYEKALSWGRVIYQGTGEEPCNDVEEVVHNEWLCLHSPEIDSVNIEALDNNIFSQSSFDA